MRICYQKIHVTPINVALNYVTKSLQRKADMETPTNLRQDDYTITKIKIINPILVIDGQGRADLPYQRYLSKMCPNQCKTIFLHF